MQPNNAKGLEVFQQFLTVKPNFIIIIFRRLILHQNSADIRLSQTFFGGFLAASTNSADMANFRRLGVYVIIN